jgi:hypothetical protein
MTFILFVFMHAGGGVTLTTQEFNTVVQCQIVANHLKENPFVNNAFCVGK